MNNIEVKRCTNVEVKKFNKKYGGSVRINRADWKIQYVNDLVVDGVKLAGLCFPHNKIIYVDVNIELEETLLHEIFHAEVHEAGLKQHSKWDSDLEEIIAELVSRGLANMFKIRRK